MPTLYGLTIPGPTTAILLATAHQEYGKSLRMASLFSKAAKEEDAPQLANLARSYAEEAEVWETFGRNLEAVNPDLEPMDWRPDLGQLQDFLDALSAIGFKFDHQDVTS